MRVLIIHASPWNDATSGNNVLTNWFEGIEDMEIANIYRGSGKPNNHCCRVYFQISDRMIIDSILKKQKAGISFVTEEPSNSNKEVLMKQKLKPFSNEFTQLCRSLLWLIGVIDEESLKEFIEHFSPDVVFTCRKASLATLRVERLVHKYTNAPFVAFTGDDEYSLRQYRFDPFFWIDRFAVRKAIRNNAKFYKTYLTLSREQALDYAKKFKVNTGVLRKCGSNDLYSATKKCVQPIRLMYAGKLYCNRWKTLSVLAKKIDKINNELNEKAFQLDIYAVDAVPRRMQEQASRSESLNIHPAVPANELPSLFMDSDIVLHVESFDLRNRYDTRLSFSTKIVDCLASGCAVMAICWEQQSGYRYLLENDLAFCTGIEGIETTLNMIQRDRTVIQRYAKKAHDALIEYHSRKKIQEDIKNIFLNAIG